VGNKSPTRQNKTLLMEQEKMSNDKKYEGTVIWFNPKPGIGFIDWEGESDIFIHFSDIVSDGFKTLKKGQKVSFGIGKNNEGRDKAVEVVVIKDVE
jgi:CspA family cold shock protein